MFGLFILEEVELVDEGAWGDTDEGFAPVSAHPPIWTTFFAIDALDGFESQVGEVVHRGVGLDFNIASIASVSAVWFAPPDPFVGKVGNDTAASISGFDDYFNAVWKVFELEFGDLASFLFDSLGGSAEERLGGSDQPSHIDTINNNWRCNIYAIFVGLQR